MKNIILRLKNNIEIVSAGKIKSTKSVLNIEGILAKIKCMKYVANDIDVIYVSLLADSLIYTNLIYF